MNKAELQTITLGVIAYNEQNYLPDLLFDLLGQSYPKELTEIILVDGVSTDGTLKIIEEFFNSYNDEYKAVKVFTNKKRVQPAGWNIVIDNSECDVIIRIDAHARLPLDFIQSNMRCINSGEDVCGGPRDNIIDENTFWKRMLLDAEQSMFGSGIAPYRNKTDCKKYVSSVFHGAYRHEVFDKVGRFNESLIRTEDNEMHYRIRKSGYAICYDPLIRSQYQTRNSLFKMIKQKYQNGLWIGRTLYVCPKCISLFHLVPLAFVLSLVLSLLLMIFGIWQPIALIGVLYCLFLFLCFLSTLKNKNPFSLVLPIVIFLIHISYGVGTLRGLLSRR